MSNPSAFFRKGRGDLSNFLVHLTKNGSYEDYQPFAPSPGGYRFSNSTILDAEDSLRKILANKPGPTILARAPFGHFKFNVDVGYQKRGGIPLDWIKSVCFSETPLRELKSFYTATQDPKNTVSKLNKYQKFGLAFHNELVRSKNGHPIFYFDSRRADIISALNSMVITGSLSTWKPLLPLFEQYGPKLHSADKSEIDFRWEREWRVTGDFKFNLTEVAFGLCPENKISDFQTLAGKAFPFIDPDWPSEQLQANLISGGWKSLAEAL